ncbi:MAG TPA: peptidogalycan biosysnthesis protein, partial [Burkholderiaceae bacterium]|nr:peptidogalycan biosysnthesis protein [Burkholderiaceae bacterium]
MAGACARAQAGGLSTPGLPASSDSVAANIRIAIPSRAGVVSSLYAKEDSWGEFIFDFQWARAAAAARIRYYPKLVSMVPFTPATGRRLLVSNRLADQTAVAALGAGLREAADDVGASSIHVLYLTAEERDALVSLGSLRPRVSV